MSEKKYYPPEYSTAQFHCPYCGVFAEQKWSYVTASGSYKFYDSLSDISYFSLLLQDSYTISQCQHCNKESIWLEEKMIYPKVMIVSEPNEDLSQEIKKDYIEAASILNDSPRASAALLRLALQKLCKELGGKGENVNDDIGNLVKEGLNPLVQKSLDSLRITGNNAVHPGEINLEEDPSKVVKLFELINFIADKMMTEPKKVESFYDNLPENKRKQVEVRDKLRKQNT